MAKNFLKAGILKARAMYDEETRGFYEGGYVDDSKTKVAERLLGKRTKLRIQTPDTSILENQRNSSLVRRRQEITEESSSNLDNTYNEIRRQNQLLRDEMEAMSDQDFYSDTGDDLGNIRPPVSRKSEFPTFDKVVPTFSAKQNELQSYIFEKAKDRGYKGEELAQFMAQSAIETNYFRTLEEYGGGKDKYGGGKRFWETNVRPKVTDFSNTKKVTRIVNGPGMLKTPERNDAFNFMKLSGNALYEE